jgi:hypothetical protein
VARGKTTGAKVRDNVRKAGRALDRALDHLMAADITAKGGSTDGHGKFLPAGVDLKDPAEQGHPVLNQYLPMLVPALGSLKTALKDLVKKL